MGDNSIQIEYNQELNPLAELLDGVERSGDFFVSGTWEIPMPKVTIDGVGVLSFPVPPTQTGALIENARKRENIYDRATLVTPFPTAKLPLNDAQTGYRYLAFPYSRL